MSKNHTIFIVAGEASGDVLGAKLMASLKQQDSTLYFEGIGGKRMVSQGLKSLFNMSELSLMGFLEILPHAPNLINRLNQTVEAIHKHKPSIVVTIDSPGFNFRLAKKLQGSGIPLVHYVAPTVWAYKPERAQKVADLYDHLLVILPFEKPYFDKVNVPTTYVGHPIVEDALSTPEQAEAFKERHAIESKRKVICALPGSRHTEIKRLLPIFGKTFEALQHEAYKIHVVIPTVDTVAHKVQQETALWRVPVTVVNSVQEKQDAFAASDIALVKSGTGALEISMAGLPCVVTYKINPLSYWYIKRFVTVKYANLVNLILDEEAIPELIQDQCTPYQLSSQINALLTDETTQRTQLDKCQQALNRLGSHDDQTPSDKAAKVLLSLIE